MNNKNRIIITILSFIFVLNGCAAVEIKNVNQVQNITKTLPVQKVNTQEYDADTVVVKAKWVSKLEKIKIEAVRRNNKETFSIAAGTAGVITAFIVSNAYFNSRNEQQNPIVGFAITAATAYAAAFIAGFIFDLFTIKK